MKCNPEKIEQCPDLELGRGAFRPGKVCAARQEQLLTPAAPATILTMKAPQIILELSAAEGLS